MGAPNLFAAAAGISPAAVSACAALRAELEAGCWTCADEVRVSFPRASWSKNRITITLEGALDAIVAFNFERGIAVIDISQTAQKLTSPSMAERRRSA